MENDILWQKIRDGLRIIEDEEIPLLYPRKNSKKFMIIRNTEKGITIQFIGGKNSTLHLKKTRFFSAHNFLKQKQGKYLYIGSAKTDPVENSIEYRIKMEYNGKENSTATSAWICTLLKKVFFEEIGVDRNSGHQRIKLKKEIT